jgi:predicted dehydrogenase/putative sterol carrier protein
MIQVGIIGLGRIADVHHPGYARTKEARIYAVCDSDNELAIRRKKEWRADKYYTDYHELLADPKVDAVEIITPHSLHEIMVIDALKAGKHVAVQKPMTISLDSASRMIDAAEKSGTVFKVTDNYAFYPPIQLAKKIIDDGQIGEPANISIHFVGGSQGGWIVPAKTWEWRMKENEEGKGMRGLDTFDHGHHLWTTAWYLLGEVDRTTAWIDSVDGIVDSPSVVMWKHKKAMTYGMCEFFHGTNLRIPSRYYGNDEWIQIGGSRGIIFINRCTGNIHDGPAVSLFTDAGWKHYKNVKSDWGEGFIGAAGNFFKAINGLETPLLSGKQGRDVLKFSLAIQKSAQIRREVYLDELDSFFPALYSRRRINKEKKSASKKKSFFQLIFGEGTAKYAAQAHESTLKLMDSFDRKKAGDWKCDFALRLLADGNTPEKIYSFYVNNGSINYSEGKLPENPSFVITAQAGVWAAILLKKKRIETAFIQGKMKIDGKVEDALKLRSVFGI